jgi:hypothetical protein
MRSLHPVSSVVSALQVSVEMQINRLSLFPSQSNRIGSHYKEVFLAQAQLCEPHPIPRIHIGQAMKYTLNHHHQHLAEMWRPMNIHFFCIGLVHCLLYGLTTKSEA